MFMHIHVLIVWLSCEEYVVKCMFRFSEPVLKCCDSNIPQLVLCLQNRIKALMKGMAQAEGDEVCQGCLLDHNLVYLFSYCGTRQYMSN